MNRLHVITKVNELALNGTTEVGEIFRLLRNELSTVSSSVESLGLKRTDIEHLAKQALEQVSNALFPCERRRLELDVLEGKLRADVLDALATIDLSNPSVAREVFEAHRAVGFNTGTPSIRTALDVLDGAGVDCAALNAQLDALYPAEAE